MDFYFPFSLWTSISLFSLDFYFPFSPWAFIQSQSHFGFDPNFFICLEFAEFSLIFIFTLHQRGPSLPIWNQGGPNVPTNQGEPNLPNWNQGVTQGCGIPTLGTQTTRVVKQNIDFVLLINTMNKHLYRVNIARTIIDFYLPNGRQTIITLDLNIR